MFRPHLPPEGRRMCRLTFPRIPADALVRGILFGDVITNGNIARLLFFSGSLTLQKASLKRAAQSTRWPSRKCVRFADSAAIPTRLRIDPQNMSFNFPNSCSQVRQVPRYGPHDSTLKFASLELKKTQVNPVFFVSRNLGPRTKHTMIQGGSDSAFTGNPEI